MTKPEPSSKPTISDEKGDATLSLSEKPYDELTEDEFGTLLGLEDELPAKADGEPEEKTESATPPEEEEEPADDEEEGDEHDEDEDEEEQEEGELLKPFDERLKEFEVVESETPQPKNELKELEEEISREYAELQAIASDLPQGGIFKKDNKSIYDMNHQEINDYLLDLRDNAREFEAGQVQSAYLKAIEKGGQYQQRLKVLQEKALGYENKRNVFEWSEVRREVSSRLPELSEADFQKIGNYIDQKALVDADYYKSIQTKEGKLLAGRHAMNELGILKDLKNRMGQAAKEPGTTAPPDAGVVRKKVTTKSKNTGKASDKVSNVTRMKQSDFNALSDAEIDRLLEETFS